MKTFCLSLRLEVFVQSMIKNVITIPRCQCELRIHSIGHMVSGFHIQHHLVVLWSHEVHTNLVAIFEQHPFLQAGLYNQIRVNIFTSELNYKSASVLEFQSIIQYLIFRQPVWSRSSVEKVYVVYGQQTPLIQAVWKWIRLFKEGWETVKDEEWTRRLTDVRTSNSTAGVRALLKGNHWVTMRQIKLLMNKEMHNPVSYGTMAVEIPIIVLRFKFQPRMHAQSTHSCGRWTYTLTKFFVGNFILSNFESFFDII